MQMLLCFRKIYEQATIISRELLIYKYADSIKTMSNIKHNIDRKALNLCKMQWFKAFFRHGARLYAFENNRKTHKVKLYKSVDKSK